MVVASKGERAAVTATQKRAKLRELAKNARTGIFDMLRLTCELLDDHDYIDELGGEGKFLEQLTAHEFAHFGGSPSVEALVEAYRANPKRSVWEQYKFNVWAMIDLANPRGKGDGQKKEYTNWRALARELQQQVKQLQKALDDAQGRNQELLKRCDELSHANGVLEGKVMVLEGRVRS